MKKHWTVWPKESYIWFLKTVGKGWNFHRSFGQMRCVSIFVDPTIHCVPAPISQPISLWQMFCRWRDVIAKARFINLGGILKWPFRNGDDCENMMEKMCWNRWPGQYEFWARAWSIFSEWQLHGGSSNDLLEHLESEVHWRSTVGQHVFTILMFICIYIYISRYADKQH